MTEDATQAALHKLHARLEQGSQDEHDLRQQIRVIRTERAAIKTALYLYEHPDHPTPQPFVVGHECARFDRILREALASLRGN